MGFRGVPSSDLNFDDVELPLDSVIVPAGGFKEADGSLRPRTLRQRHHVAGSSLGRIDDVQAYVQERKQFGRPIVEFQGVQIKLAEMKIRVEGARLLIHRAASNAEDGMPSILESSIAKCYANEISREVTGTAVQLMGGYGYSKEYPMERRLRDSWGWGLQAARSTSRK